MTRVIHVRISIPKQYQMMKSSLARVKFIKTKVIFSYHTTGVSSQVSSNSDHKVKSYSCLNSSTKMGKNEKLKNIFWFTKRGNKGITNWGRIQGLYIGAIRITNRGSFNDFKSGQKDCKSRQGFQIGPKRFQICFFVAIR